MTTIRSVRAMKNPHVRAEKAAAELRRLDDEARKWRSLRDDAVEELLDDGVRPVDVASIIGVTRAALSQRFGKSSVRQQKNGHSPG